MSDTLIGLYPSRQAAESVARTLIQSGTDPTRLGVVERQARLRYLELVEPARSGARDPAWGLLGGALSGATVGAIVSALVGLLPGLDWLLGAQASPSVLGAAGVGALLGSALGGLMSLGRRPKVIEADPSETMLLLDVAPDAVERLAPLLRTTDALAVEHIDRPWRAFGWRDAVPWSGAPLHDAELAARQVRPARSAGPAAVRRAAYQLGVLLANTGRGIDWVSVAPIARARWETGPYADTAFARVESEVRAGYEATRAAPV